MPAIRINTQDKDLAEKTFHTILRNCGFDYLPEEIYVIKERGLEWLKSQNLPIGYDFPCPYCHHLVN